MPVAPQPYPSAVAGLPALIEDGGGLLNAGDIARRYDVSRARVSEMIREDGFPAPLGHVGEKPVWLAADVQAYRERRRRRQKTRRRRGKPAGNGPHTAPKPVIMRAEDLARELGVSPRDVVLATRAGELRAVHPGGLVRYRLEDGRAWLEAKATGD